MAAVLGVSGLYHDAAAALVIDGKVVAAMQQERLSRIKNDPSLPADAARACLAIAGITARTLDAVVFYEEPFRKLERVLVSSLRSFPRGWRQFPRAVRSQLTDKIWVLDALSEMLGIDRRRVQCVSHHRAHAASAFFPSPYPRAAVLTVDGVGEDTTTAIWSGHDRELELVASMEWPHSLGLFYAALTAWLGFEVLEGEYKMMGLAAWGEPRYRREIEKLIRLYPEGDFELDLSYFDSFNDVELGFGRKLEALLGPRRQPARPWRMDDDEQDRHYADVAATVQTITEEALLGLARRARAETDAACLCLAGGVALNALANARILRESGFERVFVQPAAGDAGGALGAAILGALELGDRRPEPLKSVALGTTANPDEAAALCDRLGLSRRRVSDPARTTAELLSENRIVAVVQGRGEFGPRALGHRSILASPESTHLRDRINALIKRREPFRPFAPAILAERCSEYFEASPDDMTPFMTTVGRVRPDPPTAIAGVVHRDGTSRLQTVTSDGSPELALTLRRLTELGKGPVVLNTSLNGAGEPMVSSALDAVGFFLAHEIDALVIEDLVVERRA